MSYHIYITEAIVFKKFDVGEADRIYSFFTKDFGRLDIKAQGVRHLKSKLRYSLSGFSFLKVAFVATAGGYWRLIDVEEVKILNDIRKNSIKGKYCLRFFSLMDRLIQGQEKDKELWDKIVRFFTFIDKEKTDIDLRKNAISFAADVVAHLGYADTSAKNLDPVLVIRSALEQSML